MSDQIDSTRPSEIEALESRVRELEAQLANVGLRSADLMAPRALVSPIVDDAARHTGFTRENIVSARRDQPLARVRIAIYWAARAATTHSIVQIGRAIGGRDHTTVLSGLRRAEALRCDVPGFRVLSDLLAAKAKARTARENPPCPL